MAGYERIVVPRPDEPPCPAAALVSEAAGGTGCVCRVTESLIDSRRNPSTLQAYCFSSDGYRECPTWRTDREEFWRSKTIRDLLSRSGDRVAGHPEDRERNQALAQATDAQEREAWERQQQRQR